MSNLVTLIQMAAAVGVSPKLALQYAKEAEALVEALGLGLAEALSEVFPDAPAAAPATVKAAPVAVAKTAKKEAAPDRGVCCRVCGEQTMHSRGRVSCGCVGISSARAEAVLAAARAAGVSLDRIKEEARSFAGRRHTVESLAAALAVTAPAKPAAKPAPAIKAPAKPDFGWSI